MERKKKKKGKYVLATERNGTEQNGFKRIESFQIGSQVCTAGKGRTETRMVGRSVGRGIGTT